MFHEDGHVDVDVDDVDALPKANADHRRDGAVVSSFPVAPKAQEPATRIEDTSFATEPMGNLTSKAKEAAGRDEDDGGWSDDDFFNDDDDNDDDNDNNDNDDDRNNDDSMGNSGDNIMANDMSRFQPLPVPANHPPPPPAAPHHQQTAFPHPLHHVQRRRPPTPPSLDMNPTQRRLFQMLSGYISTLQHPDFLPRLHRKLHSYQTRSTPPPSNAETTTNANTNTNTAAHELKHYYATRPGLRKYTLGVELTRMDYELTLPNGRRTNDKDVIRSYFGVGEDGEWLEGDGHPDAMVPTAEELLIRSANQSLLADALVALTVSERDDDDDNDDVSSWKRDDVRDPRRNDPSHGEKHPTRLGLILSGPRLCMTSVAETCRFQVDLQNGMVEAVCDLAIGVPYHHGQVSDRDRDRPRDDVAKQSMEDGRLVLARAKVSVRFRPGGEGGDDNDEPTVQYAVLSIHPHHSPDSPLLRHAAMSLAKDHEDPFFQEDYEATRRDERTTDARDFFLMSHHLLSDSRLLAVSDHLVRLRGAAEAGSTGFRSALQQLDGVTNVSGKFQFLRATAGAAAGDANGRGGGFGGFGFSLPSAEEIEAAEREAAEVASFERRREQNSARSTVFDHDPYRAQPLVRQQDVPPGHPYGPPFAGQHPQTQYHGQPFLHKQQPPLPPPPPPPPPRQYGQLTMQNQRPPPPPPPPPMPTQPQQDRPRPIIGGLFMSGLSRLAGAATQPDNNDRNESNWEEGGGTGLTPPASPKPGFPTREEDSRPVFYRREEDIAKASPGNHYDRINSSQYVPNSGANSGDTGSRRHETQFPSNDFLFTGPPRNPPVDTPHSTQEVEKNVDEAVGWSDDELNFEDGGDDDFNINDGNQGTVNEEQKESSPPKSSSSVDEFPSRIDNNFDSVVTTTSAPISSESAPTEEQPITHVNVKEQRTEPDRTILPTDPKHQVESAMPASNTYEEEFTLIMKERVEEEMQEMAKTGRMRRWRPISEDPIARQRLMKVMLSHIQ
ncbi:hypothetical protein ACHAXS_007556 [Conticribra weissflogii]